MDNALFVHVADGTKHLLDELRCILLCVRSPLHNSVKELAAAQAGQQQKRHERF